MNDHATWAHALVFLFEAALRKIDMGPLKMTTDNVEVETFTDPRFSKMRVIATFWVEKK